MKISRYRLHFELPPNSRAAAGDIEGALIRHEGGFGCLQPWPSLGDADLDDQLAALRAGEPTEVGRACLKCCEIDGVARRAERWLFEGAEIPPSHVLWDGGDPPQGADVVKVKSGDLVEAAAAFARVRVDFNASMDADGVRSFARSLSASAFERIEFVEDPMPYDGDAWAKLAAETGLDFALDRGPQDAEEGFVVRVWKPACVARPPAGKRYCITHNMDHEIGRRYAALCAARFDGELVECGLGGVPDRDGSGLGCDDLLAKLDWETL